MLLRCLPPRLCTGLRSVRASYLHNATVLRSAALTNMLATDIPPAVQVKTVSEEGIQLASGLILPSACIFLEGSVYLWDVPFASSKWDTWKKEHFEIFEAVVPRPELLLLGTGKQTTMPPLALRDHLRELGIGLEISDTRNACSTYNMLAEEGRRVAAALLPLSLKAWTKDIA